MQCDVSGCDQEALVELTIVVDDDLEETRPVCLDCLDGLTAVSGLSSVRADVETID